MGKAVCSAILSTSTGCTSTDSEPSYTSTSVSVTHTITTPAGVMLPVVVSTSIVINSITGATSTSEASFNYWFRPLNIFRPLSTQHSQLLPWLLRPRPRKLWLDSPPNILFTQYFRILWRPRSRYNRARRAVNDNNSLQVLSAIVCNPHSTRVSLPCSVSLSSRPHASSFNFCQPTQQLRLILTHSPLYTATVCMLLGCYWFIVFEILTCKQPFHLINAFHN